MNKPPFLRFLGKPEPSRRPHPRGSRNKAEARSRKSEQQNPKHFAEPIQMKILSYLSRILVCLPTLSYQTKSKTKPDPRIVGSNRTREQLWPPSSVPRVLSNWDSSGFASTFCFSWVRTASSSTFIAASSPSMCASHISRHARGTFHQES